MFLFAGSLVGSLAPFVLGCADRRLAIAAGGGGDHLGALLGWSVTASLLTCAVLFHAAGCVRTHLSRPSPPHTPHSSSTW
jgi:hypothetical protein